MDLARGVGVVLGGGELAEVELNDGELGERPRFVGLVAQRFFDPQRFLDRSERGLKAGPRGGLVYIRNLPTTASRSLDSFSSLATLLAISARE